MKHDENTSMKIITFNKNSMTQKSDKLNFLFVQFKSFIHRTEGKRQLNKQ